MRLMRRVALSVLATSLTAPAAARAREILPASPAVVAAVPRAPFIDLGRPPNVPVRLVVVLRYRNESELRTLSNGVTDFFSTERALSPQQFTRYFSPTTADYEGTAAALTRMGFAIVKTYANRTVLDVQAPAAVVDRAFDTDIHAVVQREVLPQNGRAGLRGGLRYANVRPATLPRVLRSSVYGISGFDNLYAIRPTYVLGQPTISTGVGVGAAVTGTGPGPRAVCFC